MLVLLTVSPPNSFGIENNDEIEVRLMTIARRMAFGFRSMGNLIAAIMLRCPNLPAAPPPWKGLVTKKVAMPHIFTSLDADVQLLRGKRGIQPACLHRQ